MKERIKKQVEEVMIYLFLPVFMATWAVVLGLVSIYLVISTLWNIWSFF
jgi:hypothetical protein